MVLLYYIFNPPVRTNSYGCRTFSYTAPTVWKKVPDCIRNAPLAMSFRKQLKTYYFEHLFTPHYGCHVLFGSQKSSRFWHCQICRYWLWLKFQDLWVAFGFGARNSGTWNKSVQKSHLFISGQNALLVSKS